MRGVQVGGVWHVGGALPRNPAGTRAGPGGGALGRRERRERRGRAGCAGRGAPGSAAGCSWEAGAALASAPACCRWRCSCLLLLPLLALPPLPLPLLPPPPMLLLLTLTTALMLARSSPACSHSLRFAHTRSLRRGRVMAMLAKCTALIARLASLWHMSPLSLQF